MESPGFLKSCSRRSRSCESLQLEKLILSLVFSRIAHYVAGVFIIATLGSVMGMMIIKD